MNAQTISMFAAAALSLAFSYVPGLVKWFEPKEDTIKRLIMLGFLVLVTVGSMALTCANVVLPGINLVCSQQGITDLAVNLLLAIIANQSLYAISPVPQWRKDLKAEIKAKQLAGQPA